MHVGENLLWISILSEVVLMETTVYYLHIPQYVPQQAPSQSSSDIRTSPIRT